MRRTCESHGKRLCCMTMLLMTRTLAKLRRARNCHAHRPFTGEREYAVCAVSIWVNDGSYIKLNLFGLRDMPVVPAAHVVEPLNEHGITVVNACMRSPQIIIGQSDEAKFGLRKTHTSANGGQLYDSHLGLAFSGPLPSANWNTTPDGTPQVRLHLSKICANDTTVRD